MSLCNSRDIQSSCNFMTSMAYRPSHRLLPSQPVNSRIRPLHLNGYWLPPVSHMQIPPDIELGGPKAWESQVRLCHTAKRYRSCRSKTSLDLSSHGKDLPLPRACGQRWKRGFLHLSDANEGRRKPVKGNLDEDPTLLGRVMREEGWWPKLPHWVNIITATKGVGPTQGLAVYINTKYSDFMEDVLGGQEQQVHCLPISEGQQAWCLIIFAWPQH